MDVNQANPDTRLQALQGLQDLAGRLTPEQAGQVRERVRDRVSAADLSVDDASVSGALDLLFALPRGVGRLPNLLGGMRDMVGGAGQALGSVGDVVGPAAEAAGATGELAGVILAAIGDILGGLGDLSR